MTTELENTNRAASVDARAQGNDGSPRDGSDASEPTWKPPEQRPGFGFWLLMLLSLGFVGGLAYMQYSHVDKSRRRGTERARVEQLPILGELPDFSLIERSGRRVGLADLRGRIWIADFVFTYCAGPCPVMSVRMAELQSLLKKEGYDDVVCVTITVDPERDTPKRLQEYADALGADKARWLFLTGEKKSLRELAIQGFRIAVEDPEQGDDQILHSTRFVLIDRIGRIRGYYSILTEEEEYDLNTVGSESGIPEAVKRDLLADIRGLRREGTR